MIAFFLNLFHFHFHFLCYDSFARPALMERDELFDLSMTFNSNSNS